MNMYSALRNNINLQKLFTLWKTYKTMAKPHLTHYYVAEEEIAQCQTKAYPSLKLFQDGQTRESLGTFIG